MIFFITLLFQRERQRQKAARGEGNLLAKQPIPESLALVPQSFRFRPGRMVNIAISALFLGMTLLVGVPAFFDHQDALFFIVFASGILVIGMITYGILYFSVAATITINDEYIAMRRYGREVVIPWEDVRLFAEFSLANKSKPNIIEVSSKYAIIRWLLIPNPTVATTMTHKDEDAFLSHIAVRSNLPLYRL